MASLSHRAVLTGVGVVNPLGLNTAAFWDALQAGQSGIHSIESFDASKLPARIGGEVRGRDVIVLDPVMADDPFSALAHEIGHHINHRLGGLSPFESSFFTNSDLAQLSQVTANMRRVARFDAYFAQNKDEFYAEAWSLFLCGENRPTLFRYLSRPLRRLRVRHPEAARLIEGCRQIV